MEKESTRTVQGHNNENNEQISTNEFRVYKKRWFVMINQSLLNLTIATIWLSFSTVAYKASAYYNVSVATINWLSMSSLILSIIFGFFWSWLMNKIGLRTCMLTSAWMAATGASLRICSTIESLPHGARLTFLFAGQIFAGVVQPLGIYSAPKLSAIWFPSHQRSISTTVSGIANPAGIILTGIVSPLFVDDQGIIHMRNMLITYSVMPLLCAFMTTVIMTTDGPPTPPSYGSTVTTSANFFKGVKDVLRNKTYVLLMFSVGSGIALYSSFATLVEQLLCPWGYTDTIAGVCGSVMTGAGLAGAIIASIFVDRTRRFAEALKFMFMAAAFSTIIFTVTHKIYMGYLIALIMGVLGFLSFGISPIGMETGAECTFPVGVSIGTAMIQITGQTLSIIMILVLQSLGRSMTSEELTHYGSKCHFSNSTGETTLEAHPKIITYDLTVSTYVMSGIMTLVALLFLVLFHPTYKRMNAEKALATATTQEITSASDASSETSTSKPGADIAYGNRNCDYKEVST